MEPELDDNWEDPYDHMLITMCSGCEMCATWEGRPHEDIRAERRAHLAGTKEAI